MRRSISSVFSSQFRQFVVSGLCCLFLWQLTTISFAADTPNKLPRIRVSDDGRGFVTEDGKPFIPMGVNYFRPNTGWSPLLWKKFDDEAIRKDFALMKSMGVNCVRVFISYGSFFWEGTHLQGEGLEKFDRFLTIAEEAGIYVHPTGPDGWEGWPTWTKEDRLADEPALASLETFWREFAGRYQGRTVIFAYDLLNEPFASFDTWAAEKKWNAWLQNEYGSAEKTAQAWGVAPDTIHWGQEKMPPMQDAPGQRRMLDYQHFREQLADDWTRRQVEAIRAADPKALVTVGLLQYTVPTELCSVRYYAAYRPERQAKYLDFLELHFYPATMNEFTEENVQKNLAYVESVVREVAKPGKPVVIAEFGWYGGGKLELKDQNWGNVSEEQQAQWCSRLVETTRPFATGWLNWGLHDHPEALDCTQRSGLLTVDGKPKAWAHEFTRLTQQFSKDPTPPTPPTNRPTLDWERAIIDSAVGRQFGEDYRKAFQAK